MNLVACPRCAAQFDVSTFTPGSKFVCGACQNLLQVPAAPPSPVVQPVAKAPPDAPAALAKKPAVDRRRAGDAGPAGAKAPAEGRAERIRRMRGEGGDAPKKNPLPLVLCAVVLVAAVVGGAIYAMGGGGKGPEPGSGAGTAPRKAEPADTKALDAAKRIAVVQEKHREALASVEAVKAGVEWFRNEKLPDDAKQILDAGHKAFPADPWINGELGFRNRAADLKATLDDEILIDAVDEVDPNMAFLRGLDAKVKADKLAGWLTKEESGRFDQAVAAIKEAAAKLSDPVYRQTLMEFKNVSSSPEFIGMHFAFRGDFRPYVIFAESSDPENLAKADQFCERVGKSMTWVYGAWLKFMKDELKLDPPRAEDMGDHRFRVFVFRSRESFDAWHERNKQRNPGQSVAAYYEPNNTRMVMMYVGEFDPHIIMHEGTHQLIHYYARYFCEKDDQEAAKKQRPGDPPPKVEFNDRRLNSAFFWFQEGIAEYFGAAGLPVGGRPSTEKDWRLGRIFRTHLKFFQTRRKDMWPVEEFIGFDQGQIEKRASVRSGGLSGDDLKGLMYAQGWTLAHYFLHGENGKYRERFLAMMRNELRGISGRPYLMQAFGLVDGSGRQLRMDDPKVKAFYDEVQAGYLKYLDELTRGMGRDE